MLSEKQMAQSQMIEDAKSEAVDEERDRIIGIMNDVEAEFAENCKLSKFIYEVVKRIGDD